MAKRKGKPAAGNSAAVEQAARLFREFRDDEPGRVTELQISLPKAAMVIGELELVGYRTDHAGKAERYIHKFKPGARPAFLASADGRMLIILPGKFRFTPRGIVDTVRGRR